MEIEKIKEAKKMRLLMMIGDILIGVVGTMIVYSIVGC